MPRAISRYRRCTGPPPTRNCVSSPAAGVRRGNRLVPEHRRRLRRPDPLTGPPGLRISGRYLESRSAPTPVGNGRPVCAGIWAPPGKRPVTESPGAKALPCLRRPGLVIEPGASADLRAARWRRPDPSGRELTPPQRTSTPGPASHACGCCDRYGRRSARSPDSRHGVCGPSSPGGLGAANSIRSTFRPPARRTVWIWAAR